MAGLTDLAMQSATSLEKPSPVKLEMRLSKREAEAIAGCRGVFWSWVGRASSFDEEEGRVLLQEGSEGPDTNIVGASREL